MGWGVWPKRRTEWPTSTDTCMLCGKPVEPGEKYYLDGDATMHALCEWKRVEEETR